MKLKDYRDREIVWLLDFEYCGKEFRFADRAISMENQAGEELRYLSGLEPLSSKRAIELGSKSSANIEIDADIDWAKLFADYKIPLEGHRAKVRRAYVGEPIERAELVANGRIVEVEYGAKEEGISFKVERIDVDHRKVIPDATEVIDAATLPFPISVANGNYVIPEDAEGTSYNIIIGYPGLTGKCVVPTTMVSFNPDFPQLSICVVGVGHLQAETVEARIVEGHLVLKPDAEAPLIYTTDKTGRPVTVLDLTHDVSLAPSDDATTVYVAFRDLEGYGGGISWNGRLLRGAGDVICWALDRSSDSPIDLSRFEHQQNDWNEYKIDTFINEPVDAMEWLEEHVLPILPARAMMGDNGFYLLPLRYFAKRHETQWFLFADGRNVVRKGAIKAESKEIANRLVIEYSPDRSGDKYLNRVIITSQQEKEAFRYQAGGISDDRLLVHRSCSISQGRYGVKEKTIKLKSVCEQKTAVKVGEWMAARDALPKLKVEYECGLEWAKVQIGDIICVNDEEVYFNERLALVDNVELGSQEVTLTLFLLDEDL